MSTSFNPQHELESVVRRIGEHGFRFRRAEYFGASGVLIYSPPVRHSEISVVGRSVFIYARGSRWEARVTQHGGPHWIREADSIDRLEEIALEALRSPARPPTSDWKVEWS
jgi:hypothetical protein